MNFKHICNRNENELYTWRASMKALVPDLAMVPRLLIISALVIPIPVSMMVRVLASRSGMILICSSLADSSLEASVRDSYLKKWNNFRAIKSKKLGNTVIENCPPVVNYRKKYNKSINKMGLKDFCWKEIKTVF